MKKIQKAITKNQSCGNAVPTGSCLMRSLKNIHSLLHIHLTHQFFHRGVPHRMRLLCSLCFLALPVISFPLYKSQFKANLWHFQRKGGHPILQRRGPDECHAEEQERKQTRHQRHLHPPNERSIGHAAQDASRRNALQWGLTTALATVPPIMSSAAGVAAAAVGRLSELQDANVIVQGVTVRVSDKSQQDAMVNFLRDSFDCKVLRRRIAGTVEETWLGFGPEQLSVPADFTLPVSSLYEYGGHASIHLVYDSKDTVVYYNIGDAAPGDNIAFVQLGVPTYRISQMAKNGGNIVDAYGIVNVVSPAGLPIRGIVGIAPDPIMFVAINCVDVKQSQAFYEKLGFSPQTYPFCRPSKGTGVFEPPQPKGSVYLAPTANGMGLLLLQSKKKKQVKTNPAVVGLNLVYGESTGDGWTESTLDPSGVGLRYQSVAEFESEESQTR